MLISGRKFFHLYKSKIIRHVKIQFWLKYKFSHLLRNWITLRLVLVCWSMWNKFNYKWQDILWNLLLHFSVVFDSCMYKNEICMHMSLRKFIRVIKEVVRKQKKLYFVYFIFWFKKLKRIFYLNILKNYFTKSTNVYPFMKTEFIHFTIVSVFRWKN